MGTAWKSAWATCEVRQVAEAHQGSATAEAAEGGGARLRLRVPVLISDS